MSQNSSKLELFCDMAQTAKSQPLLFFQNFHFLEAKKNLSIQGGPKKASYQFWQGRQFLLA